jgi:glycosyltransferase involved in cell wall biosynthesis
MKNIWILNQTAGKLDSGWGERHYYLSKYWVNEGYDVKIISGSHNHLFLKQPKIKSNWFTYENVEKGIQFCWVKVPRYHDTGFKKFISNLVYTFKLFFLNSNKLGRPDLIIISSMPIFPIINGLFFKKKYKIKKLIFEVRDLWPLTPIYLKGYSKKNPLIQIMSWFEKLAYKKSDIIVSLLPNASEYISKISKDKNKFHYIPNGIDENLVGREGLPKKIVKRIPKDKFIIGYTGTIGFANAMEYFIEASLSIEQKNIHFIIVGDGLLKKSFENSVQNANNITFIDKVKKSQVQEILKYFDVCYLGRYKSPLYLHGVSYNKYFDYMLAKKPILESSEFIKDQVELSGCGIIVPPEDKEAIINGILRFYHMKKRNRDFLGLKGYEFVKNHHDYGNLSKLYIDLFEH